MAADELSAESERRQATVLFADISGFTALSEKSDPERLATVMNRCFHTLEEVVHAHGGVVDKYIGDCIMALFGVPKAIEDAPKQAVNAAIAMRQQVEELNRQLKLPRPIGVHVGINTGLVLAGDIGGSVKREFTVLGDAVNVASRLKDASKDGQIFVGAETYRYTKERFEYRTLKPLDLKGKEKPVPVYELLSSEQKIYRSDATHPERAGGAPLVGREAELQLLAQCVAGVAKGDGLIVDVVGEAGLGKTRLVAELAALAEQRELLFLEGRSLSIGGTLSFHPFVDLLRHWLGVSEADREEAVYARLGDAVGTVFADQAGEIFPFVATLMGMRLTGAHAERIRGIDGEAMEKLILKSVRELFAAMAQRRPLLLLFEDLHWADQSSIQLLESMLRLVDDCPILVAIVRRPEYADTSERIAKTARAEHALRYREIALRPLDDRQCTQLVQNLLQSVDLPYATQKLIAGKAEGNPFFIEQVVRSLIDDGVIETKGGRLRVTDRIETVVIPGTVQEVIMARVDRLDPPLRRVLQVASVIGRSFYHRVIADVMHAEADLDGKLAGLRERQLLLERRTRRTAAATRRTFAEELEYVFTHALVQETIYESILQATRKQLHGEVARVIETLFGDRLADFYGTLAYHYSRAEEIEKAEEYLFKAGDEAARSAASSEALQYFREASRLYFLLHGDGGDPKKKALLEHNIAVALLNKGALTESIDHFDHALEHLGERVPKRQVAVYAHFVRNLAAVLLHLYRPRRRRVQAVPETEREVFEIMFNRARALTTSDPKRLFFDNIGGIRRLDRTDPQQIDQACGMYAGTGALFAFTAFSFDISARFLALAEPLVRADSVRDQFVFRSMRFIHYYLSGDWRDDWAIDDGLLNEALRFGVLWDVNTYAGLDGDRLLRQGRFDGARAQLERLATLRDAYGFEFATPNHQIMTALVLLEERKLDEALEWVDTYCAGRHEPALLVLGLGTRAKIHVLRGEIDAADTALARAGEIVAREGTLPPWHLSAYVVARLRREIAGLQTGRAAGARSGAPSSVKRAAQAAERIAGKVAVQRAEAYNLIALGHSLCGQAKAARQWWQKALETGRQLGTHPEVARTHLEIGAWLAGAGGGDPLDGAGAAEHLQRAAALFAELGLAWDTEEHARRAA